MYTLGDIPRSGAILYPENTALVFEGKRLTYRAFNKRINQFANSLIGLGCVKDDRIAIMAENCAKYLEAYFAAAKIGMSVTPINVRLGDAEVIHIVNDSEAKVFVVGEGLEERAAGIKDKFQKIKLWISFDDKMSGFLDYETLLKKSPDTEPSVAPYDINEENLAVLMYTGGTTGLPKGVMMNHRSLAIPAIALSLLLGFTRDDSTCFVLPIFHVSWWPILAIMTVGGKVCISKRPALDSILKLIEDEKCTHINLVPTIYGWMVDHPGIEKIRPVQPENPILCRKPNAGRSSKEMHP